MDVALHWHVGRAPNQAPGDEEVVDRDDEERYDIEDEEGGHGVDLGVQVPSLWIGGACHKGVIGPGDGEGVQVGEDGLWYSKGQGQQPDHGGAKADLGVRHLYVHRLDDSLVSDKTERDFYVFFFCQDTDHNIFYKELFSLH